jgi:hypothetical protein
MRAAFFDASPGLHGARFSARSTENKAKITVLRAGPALRDLKKQLLTRINAGATPTLT